MAANGERRIAREVRPRYDRLMASAATRRRSRVIIAVLLAAMLPGSAASAAELKAHTLRAFEAYREGVTRAFQDRIRTGVNTAGTNGPEDISVGPGAEDGILTVEDGLIHHWRGRTVMRGVRLETVLAVASDYAAYSRIYEPVVRSRLLGRDGSIYRVLVRLSESTAGISAVLDVRSTVRYIDAAPTVVAAITHSDEIRQVEHAGTADERLLPEGHDSGYLWRASAYTRFVQVGDDVYVEMETLGLSRGFPPLLGWIIEPIARRLGRRSVEQSLREFAGAVHERTEGGPDAP